MKNVRIVRYPTITGGEYGHIIKTGPKSLGYVKRLFRIPPEYLAALEMQSAETGGVISVNELVRRAIRMYLTEGLLYKPVYTRLVKQ